MAQVTVNLPNAPKDWKTTAFGIITAIAGLVTEYVKSGSVSWYGAAACVLLAVIFYFLPAKPGATDELELAQKIEAVVRDVLTKQPVLPDAEALVAQVVDVVQKSITVPAPDPPPAATGLTVS